MNPEFPMRIIGGTKEEKGEVSEMLAISFAEPGEKMFGEHLLEATESERKTIVQATGYVNKVVESYGGVARVDPERVFILESGSVRMITKDNVGGPLASGYCNRQRNFIAVERRSSVALQAKTLVHEALHMATPFSTAIDSEKNEFEVYRSGLSMVGRDDEGHYFIKAEEAIVETLAKRFFDEVVCSDPQYKDEIERTNKIKEWVLSALDQLIPDPEHVDSKRKLSSRIRDILLLPDSEEILDHLINSNEEIGLKYEYFLGYYTDEFNQGDVMLSREDEREKFDAVLDKMIFDSEGKLGTKEELFDDFARAHFTGSYLALGRKVERVLGKGSFRKIASELGEMNEGESL